MSDHRHRTHSDFNRIVQFFSGEAPDDRGRYLAEIQNWPDHRLEAVHDFIQWMFPLTEPSGVNPSAPLLDAESIREIHSRPELQENLRRSFLRMLRFYGLAWRDGRVERAPNFTECAENWLAWGNHNHLRITRILKCLRLAGLENEAAAFFDCLTQLYEAHQGRISPTTFRFWQDAISQ